MVKFSQQPTCFICGDVERSIDVDLHVTNFEMAGLVFTIVGVLGLSLQATWTQELTMLYFDGLVQDCSNSSALAMELLLSCTKSLIYAVS